MPLVAGEGHASARNGMTAQLNSASAGGDLTGRMVRKYRLQRGHEYSKNFVAAEKDPSQILSVSFAKSLY
jgi:hypothetical protein